MWAGKPAFLYDFTSPGSLPALHVPWSFKAVEPTATGFIIASNLGSNGLLASGFKLCD